MIVVQVKGNNIQPKFHLEKLLNIWTEIIRL